MSITEAEALRASANDSDKAAFDSYERCGTDGFVSQFCHSVSARKDRLAAEISEAGGVAEFWALFDLDGQPVEAILIPGKWGMCWALCTPGSDKFVGEFVTAFPKREATLAKKGYSEGRVTRNAYATLADNGGTGMSNLHSVHEVARASDYTVAGIVGIVCTTPPVPVEQCGGCGGYGACDDWCDRAARRNNAKPLAP
jgi:hypothetical protein